MNLIETTDRWDLNFGKWLMLAKWALISGRRGKRQYFVILGKLACLVEHH
jgi:hypothetical protein